jgi:predicted RNA polymerase sigma factor
MANEPLKELFQQEFAKMVAVISSLFGLQHIETAEDIVSDTFLTAAEEWEAKGIPPNPTAWLYMFSEGYYSLTSNRTLQKELCWEAIRLGVLLTGYELTNQPTTNALLALMCFHASRFDARQPGEAEVILYDQQDERLWDADLIRRGIQYLALSATGEQLSSYHLEARIASWHCIKGDTPGKWEEILQLYNQLLMVN